MKPVSFQPGCFGKLPFLPDFIGRHRRDRSTLAFEGWLQNGVGLGRERFASASEGFLRGMPETRFVFRIEGDQSFLVGVLVPSSDQSGRDFPFAVFLEGGPSKQPGSFAPYPILFHPFLEAASNLATRREQGLQELLLGVAALSENVPPADSLDEQVDGSLLGAQTVGEIEVSYGAGGGAGWIDGGARRLLALAHRYGAGWQEAPTFGIRFALPGTDPEARACTSFWVELTRRLLGEVAGRPSFFWSVGRRGSGGEIDPSRGRLDLYFGQPDGLAFLHLIHPEFESDALYPLHEDQASGPGEAHQSEGEDRPVDPSLALSEALDLLAP